MERRWGNNSPGGGLVLNAAKEGLMPPFSLFEFGMLIAPEVERCREFEGLSVRGLERDNDLTSFLNGFSLRGLAIVEVCVRFG